MKKIVLVSLFVFGSLLANAQNFKTHPKKPYSPTDSCLVWQDSTKRFYRIKCSEINTGGSSAIDTTKVGRIEQGRGTAPIFMYFNGVAWVKNDTSYIPREGADNISGNLFSINDFFQLGLTNNNNRIRFDDEYSTDLYSKNSSTDKEARLTLGSYGDGEIGLGINHPTTGLQRRLVISGATSSTPNNTFLFDKGLAYYGGDYRAQMTTDVVIPDIGKVKQLISDSIGTVQSTTLADGKIWIGDGTDTAFPRTLSGDVTVSNLGVTTIANGAVTNINIANGTIDLTTKVTGRLLSANMQQLNQNSFYSGNKNFALKDGNVSENPSFRKIGENDLPFRNKQKFKMFGALSVYGTSIEVGVSAESGTATEGGYVYVAANALGMGVTNNSSSGNGAYVAAINAFTSIPVLDNYNTIYIGGFINDIRKNGNSTNVNSATSNKIIAAQNSIMASHFCKTQIAVSGASITKGGSWSNFTTITTRSSGKLSGNAMSASSSGATLTYTSPVSTSIVIGCFGTDGTTKSYGGFTVSIDGSVLYTYTSIGKTDLKADFAGNDNSIIPDAIVLTGLQAKAHTVLITTTSTSLTPIDYIGTLLEPVKCTPVIVSTNMKLTAIGYAKNVGTPPNNYGSDRVFNQVDSIVNDNINSNTWCGYPISIYDCNVTFNANTGTSIDSIHPTYSIGYKALALGLIANSSRPSIDIVSNILSANNLSDATAEQGWGSNDNYTINLNRQIGTGTAINTSRPQAQLYGNIASGGSFWAISTSNANNSGITEAMRIASNQFVGIGITSPTYQLHLSNDMMLGNKYAIIDDYVASLTFKNTTAGENSLFRVMSQNNNGTDQVGYTIEAIGVPGSANRENMFMGYVNGTTDFQIYTGQSGSGSSRALRLGIAAYPSAIYINTSSNIGLGTTTPQSKLDVEGGASIGATYSGTTAAPTNGLIVEGNVGIGISSPSTKLHVEGTVVIKSYTVATLPACAAGIYTRATVTDALAPVYDATVAGGGARVIEVLCNGSTWVCH